MIHLDEIRKAIPNWPSELDVAKASSNWAMTAQAFFCAGIVLSEERDSAFKKQDEDSQAGRLFNEKVFMRTQVGKPAEFCLAFSLELAVKGALVAQGKLKNFQSGKKLPFVQHNLFLLAEEIDGFEMSPEDKRIFDWAFEVIRDGKYPVSKKPCRTKNGVRGQNSLAVLHNDISSLYLRLMTISCATGEENRG